MLLMFVVVVVVIIWLVPNSFSCSEASDLCQCPLAQILRAEEQNGAIANPTVEVAVAVLAANRQSLKQ